MSEWIYHPVDEAPYRNPYDTSDDADGDCELRDGEYWKIEYYATNHPTTEFLCVPETKCVTIYHNTCSYPRKSFGIWHSLTERELDEILVGFFWGEDTGFVVQPCNDPIVVPFPPKEDGYIYTDPEPCASLGGVLEKATGSDCRDSHRCKYKHKPDDNDNCNCEPNEHIEAYITTLREWNPEYDDATELTITPGCGGIEVDIPTYQIFLNIGPILRMPHMFDVPYPKGSVAVSLKGRDYSWRMSEYKKLALETYNNLPEEDSFAIEDKKRVRASGMINVTIGPYYPLDMYRVYENVICSNGTVEYYYESLLSDSVSTIKIEVSADAPEMILRDIFIDERTPSNCGGPFQIHSKTCHDCQDIGCEEYEPKFSIFGPDELKCLSTKQFEIRNIEFANTKNKTGTTTVFLSALGSIFYDKLGNQKNIVDSIVVPDRIIFDLSKESTFFDISTREVSGKIQLQITSSYEVDKATQETLVPCFEDDEWNPHNVCSNINFFFEPYYHATKTASNM